MGWESGCPAPQIPAQPLSSPHKTGRRSLSLLRQGPAFSGVELGQVCLARLASAKAEGPCLRPPCCPIWSRAPPAESRGLPSRALLVALLPAVCPSLPGLRGRGLAHPMSQNPPTQPPWAKARLLPIPRRGVALRRLRTPGPSPSAPRRPGVRAAGPRGLWDLEGKAPGMARAVLGS